MSEVFQPEIKLQFAEETAARVLRFRHVGSYGWAHLLIVEDTGAILIQSAWGEMSYRWSVGAIATPSLAHFFVQAQPEYLLGKFRQNAPALLADVLDEVKTLWGLRAGIVDQRRCQEISAQFARRLWDEAEEFSNLLADQRGNAELSLEHAVEEMGLSEFVRHYMGAVGLYEELGYSPSPAWSLFHDQIIPQMQAYLRRELGL